MTSEIYTVRQGDTLGKIAARHGVSVDEIIQDNRIGNRNKISAGQRLNIPKKKEKTAQISHAKEDWSETVMRFVDSIGRPIVGLAVRLVAAGKELRGTTDASGCIAPVRCNNTNETIEIHVEKTPTRGGGEKKIASYVPRRGQQKVLVQSGMHVEKSALRAHEGSPERPPRKLPPRPAEPIETRTSGGKLMKLFTGKRVASDKNLQKLIDLRYEAEFAIMAAMDYAKVNLGSLGAKGYAINDLNDTEKARIMYLCHHLGLTDAIHFIQDDIPEEDVFVKGKDGKKRLKQNGAKKLLTAQVGEKGARRWLKDASDDWIEAHRLWLEDFMNRTITPHIFTCPGGKQMQLKIDEKVGALTDVTDRLKK